MTDVLTKHNLFHYFTPYLDYLHDRTHDLMTAKYNTLEQKINKLISKNKINNKPRPQLNFYQRTQNLSDKNIFSNEEIELLNKGLKHNLPQTNIKRAIETQIIDAENAINYLPTDIQEQTRYRITDILEKQIKQTKDQTKFTKNQHTVKHIKNKLNRNNLTITKADKGNTTIIINKADYIDKTMNFKKLLNVQN